MFGFSCNKKWKTSIVLAVLCVITIAVNIVKAADNNRRQATRTGTSREYGRGTQRDSRGGEQVDELQNAGTKVDSLLVEILESVNQNEKPPEKKISDAQQTVQKARKHVKNFEPEMECEYYLLTAWTNYFQNDLDMALKTSTKAYRTDRNNNDARATQAAMAILSGEKPIVLPPEKEEETTESSSRQRQQFSSFSRNQTQSYTGPISSGFILDLDVDDIDAEMLGQKVKPLQLTCLNGTTLTPPPNQANMCLLFWQLFPKKSSTDTDSAKPGEPNDLTDEEPEPRNRREQRRAAPPMMPMTMPPTPMGPAYGPGFQPGMPFPGGPGFPPMPARQPRSRRSSRRGDNRERDNLDPFTTEVNAYSDLFAEGLDNENLRFVGINTDTIDKKKDVIKKLLESPWPWAQAMAAQPTSGAEQFADINAKKPMLAVLTQQSEIKYAGPAAGFLPPMVLENMKVNLAASDKPKPPHPNSLLRQHPLPRLNKLKHKSQQAP